MTVHELKTWPAQFRAVVERRKTHETRFTDERDYEVGDVLVLREFEPDIADGNESNQDLIAEWVTRGKPGRYTGAAAEVGVTYVAKGVFGLPPDMCVMSIGLIEWHGTPEFEAVKDTSLLEAMLAGSRWAVPSSIIDGWTTEERISVLRWVETAALRGPPPPDVLLNACRKES